MKKTITTALAVMTVILIIISFSVLKFHVLNQSQTDKNAVFAAAAAKVLPAVDTKYIDYGSVVIYNE